MRTKSTMKLLKNRNIRNSNCVILLTATVNPKGTANTSLQNVESRLCQYSNALTFYLQHTTLKIVLCENSGYNWNKQIVPLIYKPRVEFLSFNVNDYDKSKGKSYGEAKIIEYAIKNSSFIKSGEYIIKITGRVIISNINEIILKYKRKNKSSNTVFIEFWGRNYAQSVCFICSKHWILNLVTLNREKLDDLKFSIHNLLFEGVVSEKKLQIKSIYPFINGISGKTGTFYKNDLIIQRRIDNYIGLQTIYKIRKNFPHFLLTFVILQFARFVRKFYW